MVLKKHRHRPTLAVGLVCGSLSFPVRHESPPGLEGRVSLEGPVYLVGHTIHREGRVRRRHPGNLLLPKGSSVWFVRSWSFPILDALS
jgi:hypothetical protein